METGLLITAIFIAAFTMVGKRLSSTVVTAPMIFLGFGFMLSQTGLLAHADAEATLHLVAEIALIVLLFLDAAQIDLDALRKRHVWPLRMLLVGLPLSVAFGTVAAMVFLPGWSIFAVALLAAVLTPTDAALGQAVISNPVVPERSRRTITVESGLNDGLALPVILLFASLTALVAGQDDRNWVLFGAMQLIVGPLVGAAAGLIGGTVLMFAKKHDLTSDTFEGIGAIALAGGAYLGATEAGGNGFIAAFVAGLCFGHIVKGRCKFVYEFTESEGQILSWGAFLLLGMVMVPEALDALTWPMVGLILTSLLIVRPAAIWISLLGTDASPTTRIFFGWFGPRGLATALFALVIVEKIDHQYAEPILAIAINTVWISALLHGLSAVPGAKWYAMRVQRMGDCAEIAPIKTSAKPIPTRTD